MTPFLLHVPSPWDEVGTTDSDEVIMVSHNWGEICRLMWNYVGIVRSNKRLAKAKRRIENIQQEIKEYYWDFKVVADLIELRNIATVAELIITSQCTGKKAGDCTIISNILQKMMNAGKRIR